MKNKFLVFISLVILLLITNNCTLIGLGLGTIADQNNNNEYFTIDKELFSISPGTDISILTTNGYTLEGAYQSTSNIYSQEYITEYNNKYDEIRKQLVVPKINDTVYISNQIGKTYEYIFLGFDYNAVYGKSVSSQKEDFIRLNDYEFKLTGEQYLEKQWINNAIEFKTIPIMSKINFENINESYSIFYHHIYQINTNSSSFSAFVLLTGITVDLFILRNSLKHSDSPFNPFSW